MKGRYYVITALSLFWLISFIDRFSCVKKESEEEFKDREEMSLGYIKSIDKYYKREKEKLDKDWIPFVYNSDRKIKFYIRRRDFKRDMELGRNYNGTRSLDNCFRTNDLDSGESNRHERDSGILP